MGDAQGEHVVSFVCIKQSGKFIALRWLDAAIAASDGEIYWLAGNMTRFGQWKTVAFASFATQVASC